MTPDWIAIDWGTTNLRAWAMGPSGVLAAAASENGMGRLSRDQFEPALLSLVAPWLGAQVTPVLAAGMVGARQGWMEAPYRQVPCPPLDPAGFVPVPVADPRLSVRIAPGLCQARPADVMRGEETQIAGALALYPGFDGTVCLPGTHSKWAQISAGEVVSFQTFMTGELFSLLSSQSVLCHGMAPEGEDEDAFDRGVEEGLARADRLACLLFRLRAEGLLSGLSPEAARSRLSGLLIGAELAAAKPYWLGTRVLLIGAPALCGLYARALGPLGQTAERLTAENCTLAGLAMAARSLGKDAG